MYFLIKQGFVRIYIFNNYGILFEFILMALLEDVGGCFFHL